MKKRELQSFYILCLLLSGSILFSEKEFIILNSTTSIPFQNLHDATPKKGAIEVKTVNKKRNSKSRRRVKVQKTLQLNLEINKADSLDLIRLPGIGSKRASAILKYRKRLGGFIRVDQLLEVKLMDSLTYQRNYAYLNLSNTTIEKLSLNHSEFKTLLSHPYLSFEQVRFIFKIRRIIGHIAIEDLKIDSTFDAKDLERIKPYLSD